MIQIKFTISQDLDSLYVFNQLYHSVQNILFMNDKVNDFDILTREIRNRDDVTQTWCKTDKVVIINAVINKENNDD
jgi:hypothetical protein